MGLSLALVGYLIPTAKMAFGIRWEQVCTGYTTLNKVYQVHDLATLQRVGSPKISK